jgi:hypothetical protein
MKPILDTIEIANSQLCGPAEHTCPRWHVDVRPLERAAAGHSMARAVRIVGFMAFAQSLLFLVIWLLVCSSAGAATAKRAGFSTDLELSTYDPTNNRDPFSKVAVNSPEAKPLPGVAIALQLEGILYESGDPSAIVNGRLLTLNKTVTLSGANGEVKVRAVEITRDHVVVEAGDRRIDLRLNGQNSTPQP